MRKLLFLIFATLSYWITAQTAPDFTVTDSWGHTHQLYADYLDKEKTVVLKVFYVACPPCNSIAPHLEPLYQKWGGGNGDVQFIELSILQSDTDAKINVYKSSHSTTFPASGGDGGSVAAVQPYKNGTFGVYTGTPTFVVIAPDHTVNYDVSGFNIQGTIDALDAAIAATGADGMSTAIEQPENRLSLNLLSNIIDNTLILNNNGAETIINATIINLDGRIYTSVRFPIARDNPISLDVSGLSEGLWILRVEDINANIVAPYLFVKQ